MIFKYVQQQQVVIQPSAPPPPPGLAGATTVVVQQPPPVPGQTVVVTGPPTYIHPTTNVVVRERVVIQERVRYKLCRALCFAHFLQLIVRVSKVVSTTWNWIHRRSAVKNVPTRGL